VFQSESQTRLVDATVPLDRDWLTIFACSLCLMLSIGTLLTYSFGIFVRPLAGEFHWTRTQVFGALSIGQFSVALSAPLWGWLIDRFGPRRVILPSIVCMSLAFASLSMLTPHLWHLYLIFGVFTFLGGGASPIGYSAVLVRSFQRHLGLALGLSLMGIGFGATLVPSLAQAFVAQIGWRHAYAVIGVLTLIITIPAAIVATRHARFPLPSRLREHVVIGPLIWSRAYLVMCGIFLLLAVASGGAFTSLVPMLVDRGNAPDVAARMAGLAGIAVLVGRGGIGWLLDRFNAARLLGCVCLCVVVSLSLLIHGQGRLPDSLAALLLGSVLGAEVDFTAYLVRRYFGNAAYSRLYGIAFGVFALSIGIGPLILGRSVDKMGGYNPGLFFFIVLSLIAALATFALPDVPSRVVEVNLPVK
jgi:MFS family permease